MDHLPALPSAYDHAGAAALPYLPSASSAAYLPPSSYDVGVRSPPGSGSNAPYASHAPYGAAAAATVPAKKKSSTPRRRAGADGEEPKPRKRKSVAGELNPDGTPATAPRARKPAAPKLDEHGNPIPKKRRRKSGADGDDPATAGGSGGKKKGAAAALRKLQDAIGYGDASFGGSAGNASGAVSQWDASALAGVTRGSTQVGRAPSAFHKEVLDLLYACGDESRSNAPAAFVLEDVLLELLATLTESMLATQPINCTKDALQVAAQMANSRDGSGVVATTISTAHGLRMDTLLYTLRQYPQHYARVKEMWKIALQQQEADNQAKKAAKLTQANNK